MKAWSILLSLVLAASASAQGINVGEVVSLTGADNTVARELHAGRQACATAINAAGGVHGRTLTLLTRDDHGDPKAATREAQALADSDHVAALLGPVGRPVHDAVLRWGSDNGMAVLDPYGGAMASRLRDYDTAFFVTANFSKEGELIASHLASLGIHDLAMLSTPDDQGVEALAALEEPLSMLGSRRVWTGLLGNDGHDAVAKVESMLAAHPQALVLATNSTATAAVLRALRDHPGQIQLAIPTYGLSSSISEHELLTLGEQARGFIMTQVVPSPRDTQIGIVARYRAALPKGERPSYAGLQGCIDVAVLASVLRRQTGDLGKAATLRALRAAGDVDVGGFEIDLSDRHQSGSRFTEIVLVDGEGRIRH